MVFFSIAAFDYWRVLRQKVNSTITIFANNYQDWLTITNLMMIFFWWILLYTCSFILSDIFNNPQFVCSYSENLMFFPWFNLLHFRRKATTTSSALWGIGPEVRSQLKGQQAQQTLRGAPRSNGSQSSSTPYQPANSIESFQISVRVYPISFLLKAIEKQTNVSKEKRLYTRNFVQLRPVRPRVMARTDGTARAKIGLNRFLPKNNKLKPSSFGEIDGNCITTRVLLKICILNSPNNEQRRGG